MNDYNYTKVETFYKSKLIGLHSNKKTARFIIRETENEDFSRDEFLYLLTLINLNWNGED